MTNEILKMVFTGLGIIISGLCSWLVVVLTGLLNSKIKDKKLAKITSTLTTIILNSVQQVFQTYVDALKKEGKFDKEAQKVAIKQAKDLITGQLTPELRDYIYDNFGDIESYLVNQIESTIYKLKNSK